ncbi:MAG: acetylxylan esterase [Candidatus Methanoperedens sp.]|nr:acetylxylan esterase [Candidatus Methanoperedens sp.]MCE8426044.1 acetylxylan esterase [Candidatus Methanoperedens sp.]
MSSKMGRQRERSRTGKKKSANSKIIAAIIISIILIIAYSFVSKGSDKWSVSKEGLLTYPENRGNVDVKVLMTELEGNYTLETISFASKDYTVECLFRIPLSGKKVPAVVILPGATVPKEGTQGLAEIFSNMGYASLGIEQRNRGGVDISYDYELWKEGKEPVQHKMVFDALKAVDVLRQDSRIDPERIAFVGESNGGRFAMIATAIDPRVRGIIGISTGGYDTESEIAKINDESLIRFYRSIDPDTYLRYIPPRKLVLLHSMNDTIIPIEIARKTFNKAKEPKKFYEVTTGGHGFSDEMRAPLENELRMMLQ